MHVKGYAAPETKAAVEQARLLIEQAEALGETPEDPLLLFLVLYGFWVANCRGIQWRRAARACGAVFDARREARGDRPDDGRASPHGHFLAGHGRHCAKHRAHLRSGARALRSCGTSSVCDALWSDISVATLCFRSLALWCLAIPRGACGCRSTRSKMRAKSGKPPRLMYALYLCIVDPYPLRAISRSKSASSRTFCFGR